MKTKKLFLKITSIALISSAVMSFSNIYSDAFTYNSYGTVSKTGYTLSRTYGSTNTTSSNENNTSSSYNNYTNNYTSSRNYSRTYNSNTYSDDSSNSSSGNSYYSNGSVSRTYGLNNNTAQSDTKTTTNSTSNTSTTNVQNSTNDSSAVESSSINKMLNLINQERIKHGVATLNLNNQLSEVAQLKADDMVKNNYLSHYSPIYGSIYSMISDAGIAYYNAGENIATAYSVESAHKNFMNSGLHRNAILADHFTDVGIGISKTSTGMYKISVMFIEKK